MTRPVSGCGGMVVAVSLIGLSVLGGCARGSAAGHAHRFAELSVRMTISGGPVKPDGTMALSDSPVRGETVVAVDDSGRRHAARTGADGEAALRLAPGRYTVSSSYCGTRRGPIQLTAGRTAHVRIDCDVP